MKIPGLPATASPQQFVVFLSCSVVSGIWWWLPHPVAAIVIAVIPVAVMVGLALPFHMVLLFIIFSFFRIHEVFPALYDLKLPLMLSMASISALFWHIALTQKLKLWWSKELSVISVFFLLVTVGVPAASNRGLAIEYYIDIYWKIALMTYAVAWLTRTARDFSLASSLLTGSGLLVASVAIANKITGTGLVEATRVTIGRAFGSVLGDPNDLALVLMFPVAFAVSLMLTPGIGRFQRWLGIISVPVLFYAVIATQSRGGLLGVMAVFGVFLYRGLNNRLLFIILSVAAAAIVYNLAGIGERVSGGGIEAGLGESAQGRLYAWQAAWGMALDNPFTGVGLHNYVANFFFYSPHWDGLNHAVHSTWLGVLAETGFLGLVVFIMMIVMLLRLAVRSIERLRQLPRAPAAMVASANAVFAGLIGTIVAGTFLTHGFTWPIYILAALVLAVAHWVKRHCSNDNAS